MTVRVEKLSLPYHSSLTVALLGLLSMTMGFFLRLWQRPTSMTMSEDWMSDRARVDSKQGWN